MKKLMSISGSLLAFILFLSITGCGAAANTSTNADQTANGQPANQNGGKTITIGYANWAEDIVISHLWKAILEKQGYTVKLVLGEEGTIFQGLSKGNLDVFLDAWLPTDEYANKYKDTVVPISDWFKGDAIVGLAVPSYLSQINTYEDLRKNGKIFNNQIIANEPGAGNVVTTKDAVMPGYGLDPFKLVVSSESAMIAALQKAYDAKKPIVITAWAPHWLFAKYDLKFLPDTKNLYGPNEGKSTLMSYASLGFADQNKTALEWFKHFEMTTQQMSTLEQYVYYDKMKEDDAARKWMQENESVVNKWLGK